MKILLVEDDLGVQEVIMTMLEKAGHSVVTEDEREQSVSTLL